MTPAYIALGSNLQQPLKQLRTAVKALAALPDSRLERVSSIYRSAAVGPGKQADYLNAVALLSTGLPALALLNALQQIEQQQGRVRTTRWGPRTIDLDLLLFGDEEITSPRLTVPHPGMTQRHFVLYPLCEISGAELLLPRGVRLDELLGQCPSDGLVKTQHSLSANSSAHRK